MVAYPLVDKDLEAGRDLLHLLRAARIPVFVAFWLFQEESQAWRLAIATPLVDDAGPREAYEQIQATMPEGYRLNISNVKVLSVRDELAIAMRAAVDQNPGEENLHFFRSTVFGAPVDDVFIYGARY